MRDEESVKRRLVEIEHEILKCDDLQKIWELKKEHQYLTRLLNRLTRILESQ